MASKHRRTYAVLNDLHWPFVDPVALKLSWKVLRALQPHEIHLLGDLLDFYQLSRYDKDPERRTALQADLDGARGYLQEVRDEFPKADIHFYEGNHERRLYKMLCRNPAAAELVGLRSLTIPELLGLPALRILFHPDGQPHKVGGISLIHGDPIRKHSAWTAKDMVERVGGSVIIGHSHRGGAYHLTNWNSYWVGYENFCLCQMNLGYGWGKPNWQHGMSKIDECGQHVQVTQIPFSQGSCFIDGMRLSV